MNPSQQNADLRSANVLDCFLTQYYAAVAEALLRTDGGEPETLSNLRDELQAWQAWENFKHNRITVSFGDSAFENFKNRSLEANDLVALLCKPHRRTSRKDGRAICGGALWDDADAERGKKNLRDDIISNVSVLIFEVDSGQTPTAATHELAKRFINHCVVSTFNNGTTHREIDHDALLKHMEVRGRSGTPAASDVTEYLLEHGRVTSEIAHSVRSEVQLRPGKNGRPVWSFETSPCAKFRIYIFLDTPFPIFSPGKVGRQDKMFSAFYNALAEELGILHDKACSNVSRVQYLPSVRLDGPQPFSWFVPGYPYAWHDLAAKVGASSTERGVSKKKPDTHRPSEPSTARSTGFKTKNLFRFGVTCSSLFDVETFASSFLDHRGNSNSGGICLACPNEYGDVSGRPHTQSGGTSFWVCNGNNRTDGGDGFIIHCSTDGCKEHFGGDRLRFLDDMCDLAEIEDAEALLQYTADPTAARVAFDAWDRFQSNDDGRPHANQHNIRVALRREGIQLSYNEFDGKTYVDGLEGFGPCLDDDGINRIWLRFDREYRFRPTKDYFYTVLRDEARSNPVHPLRDYLDRVQRSWDDVSRVDGWLATYLGAEDNEFNRAIGRIWLIAAVRRVREPGCKFDEMIVLESEQGKGKSTALAILAVKDDWYTDSLSLSANPKITIEQTRGKWIVEVPELLGGKKSEIEQVKAFLSRRVDESRMAFGRETTHVARAFVCGSTTNQKAYLRDMTGNRRFWSVAVACAKDLDLKLLASDRDQLWAEAARLESDGASIRLAPELWALATRVQEERRVENPYHSVLSQKLDQIEGKLTAENVYLLTAVQPAQRHAVFHEQVHEAMKSLGWTKKKIRFGKSSLTGFRNGDGQDAELQTLEVKWDPDMHTHVVDGSKKQPAERTGGLRDHLLGDDGI
jgi:hypothetical protein